MLRAAASDPPQRPQRSHVRPGLLRLGGLDDAENPGMEFRPGRRHFVEAPLAAPLVDHEPGFSQVGEVPRCRRLRNPENGDEIAYAERALAQQMEDSDAGHIREGPEDALDRQG